MDKSFGARFEFKAIASGKPVVYPMALKHVEFFDRTHFGKNYYTQKPAEPLSHYIEYFWETNFEPLWKTASEGFTDIFFPAIGHGYLLQLGTAFTVEMDLKKFNIQADVFLPRKNNFSLHFEQGNKVFGIQFKIPPVIFEKKVNFSEYRGFVYPLAYLIDQKIVEQCKLADNFEGRIEILTSYYSRIINARTKEYPSFEIVLDVLKESGEKKIFSATYFAQKHGISTRSLLRYFEFTTGSKTKESLQLLRIRKAIRRLIRYPSIFDPREFDYYDRSHFYAHAKSYIRKHPSLSFEEHFNLLNRIKE